MDIFLCLTMGQTEDELKEIVMAIFNIFLHLNQVDINRTWKWDIILFSPMCEMQWNDSLIHSKKDSSRNRWYSSLKMSVSNIWQHSLCLLLSNEWLLIALAYISCWACHSDCVCVWKSWERGGVYQPLCVFDQQGRTQNPQSPHCSVER